MRRAQAQRSRLVHAGGRHRQLLLYPSAGYDRRQLSRAKVAPGRTVGGTNVVAVASAARMSAGASIFASDNVRHLCRMELPGGGQIVIQGQYAYVGHQHRPGRHHDPRHFRSAPSDDRQQADDSHPWSHSHKVRVVGDLMVVNSEIEPGKGDRLAYPDGGFRIYDIKRQDAAEADQLRQDACARRAPLRSRRELRLHLDRDGGLRRQHPRHLRHQKPVEAGRSLALVDAGPERGGRRSRRIRRGAIIRCITPCAAATRCMPAAGSPASRSSTCRISRGRARSAATNTIRPMPSRRIRS